MDDIFHFPGASEQDSEVEAWFGRQPPEFASIARRWFARLKACGRDAREILHDGCPTGCVEDAAFAYVNAFAKHVSVGFYRGAFLEDPAGLLEGGGKRMRHVKLKPDAPPDNAALEALIQDAYQDMKVHMLEVGAALRTNLF